ncbi:MAG: hypothetical protein EXQ85_08535 [Alphaproteobacteria bacterium]|nr:hypothetical protein [Alphaproteobacteria bacterium]
MRHRMTRGRISYRAGASEIGRERFTITHHSDGARTHRALCEFDDIELLRDVTHSVDTAWRPVDVFVRLTLRDAFLGSAWFRFTEHFAECEAVTAGEGRIAQRWPTTGRTPAFVSHSVVGDVWQIGARDPDKGGVAHIVGGRLTSSILPLGNSGPLLAASAGATGVPGEVNLQYMGETDVRVPAGTFRCSHVNLVRRDTPPIELFAHGDDLMPVLVTAAFVGQSYELTEFDPPG